MKFSDIISRPLSICFGNKEEEDLKKDEQQQQQEEEPKWELTPAMIDEFKSQPYIQEALASPAQPTSVLSFYLGVDMKNDPNITQILTNGSYIPPMQLFWFAGHANFDKLCQSFVPVLRQAGTKALSDKEEWQTVNGKLSQLVLCDQLSRNCFRGTDEAFQYDNTSLELAKELANIALSDNPDFYASYSMFIVLSLMHSEDLEDHKLALECIERGKETCTGVKWDMTKGYLLQHSDVIELFGRYPHRNDKKGRETTKEESEWLLGPDVPGWAKSQM